MTPTEPRSEELAAAFANVASVLATEPDTGALLARISSLAVGTIDPCDIATVMTRTDGQPVTIAAFGPGARELDQLQIDAREGPCLDALEGLGSRYAGDLRDDQRWPRFGRAAAAAEVRSLLALHLGSDHVPGALNLYAKLPEAFAPHDRAQAAIYAAHAGLALTTRQERLAGQVEAAQLHEALRTRELIGQAQGILIERERITPQQAFDILRVASQHLNVKLREVAQRLVDTGESPDTGAD